MPVGAADHVGAGDGKRLALEAEQRLAEQDLDVRALVDPGRVRGPAELAARAAPVFLRPSVADIDNVRDGYPHRVRVAVAAVAVSEFRLPHGGGIGADDSPALVHLVKEAEGIAAGIGGRSRAAQASS